MSNSRKKRRQRSITKRYEASRSKMRVWFQNIPSTPDRMMMKYLRKRGWVVFYLEERARTCNRGTCWLKLYKAENK